MENEQKTQETAPLTAKKKRALLEYLAILCAGAFLIVALSLAIKLVAVQNDLEASDRSARENIVALQDNLDKEISKSKALEEELDSAQSAAALAESARQAAQEEADAAKQDKTALEEQLRAAQAQAEQAQNRAEATELLLRAKCAAVDGRWQDFVELMIALDAKAESLSDSAKKEYEALKTYLS